MPDRQWTFRTASPGTMQARRGLQASPVHIETNGYLLRSVVPADITTGVVDWINDQTMREGLNLPPLGLNLDRTRAFVESFDGLRQHFIGIFDPKSKLMIGFYTMDVSLEHRSANITCGIGEASYRGRRVLWHTIDALLDHFFTYRNIDKITARVLSRNIPMLFNFVDNPRFVWEAKLKRECLGVDGSRLDLLLFAAHRDARREDGTAP